LLLWRQEARVADRWQAEVEVEIQVDPSVPLLGVVVGDQRTLLDGYDLRDQHQQLFERGLIRNGHLTDSAKVG
jgi:hypothetical protein